MCYQRVFESTNQPSQDIHVTEHTGISTFAETCLAAQFSRLPSTVDSRWTVSQDASSFLRFFGPVVSRAGPGACFVKPCADSLRQMQIPAALHQDHASNGLFHTAISPQRKQAMPAAMHRYPPGTFSCPANAIDIGCPLCTYATLRHELQLEHITYKRCQRRIPPDFSA